MENIVLTTNVEEHLDMMLTTDPEVAKNIRKAVGKMLRQSRTSVVRDLKGMFRSDPRRAAQAVKVSVYKNIIGGNISILDPKRTSNTRVTFERPRKLDENPGQRGGNRMKRSKRTEKLDSYYGKNRAFILRFVNDGTAERVTKTHYARRGNIKGRFVFGKSSAEHLEQMANNFVDYIVEELNRKKK